MSVRFRKLVDLHFLHGMLVESIRNRQVTYHLEGIEFFLNLLRQHRCEPIAGRNISSTVVVLRRPGIVELYTWAECDVSFATLWCAGETSGASIRYTRCPCEVVVVSSARLLLWCIWRMGSWRIEAWGYICGTQNR
jgi:hypothetical protein